MTDEWEMAEGFAPHSRITYCQRPKACMAPATGRCPKCQMSPRVKAALHRYTKRLSMPVVTELSVPTYVDPDFDGMAE